MPPPPLGAVDWAAAPGARRPRDRASAPAQRPAARWVSRTRTAFCSLRPTGLADGLALRATTGTVRWIRPFGDRVARPPNRFPRSPAATADHRWGFGWLYDGRHYIATASGKREARRTRCG